MLFRRAVLVPLAIWVVVIAGCDTSRPSHPTNPDKLAVRTVAPFMFDNGPPRHPLLDLKATLLGVQNMLAVEFPTTTSTTTVPRPVVIAPAVTAPTSYASVLDCIKAHESGDYTSNTHPPDGSSGAYQATGPTWRYWSTKAGYGGYREAYEAPPSVQDAVVLFMLQNGGAHNWDPKYGNDPCTVGLP